MNFLDRLFPRPTRTLANPGLIRAMERSAADNHPALQYTLYEEFLKSTLLLPTPSDESSQSPLENQSVTFLAARDAQGKLLIPVFTDEAALRRWKRDGCPYRALRGAELLQLARENRSDVVVNPAGPVGGRIPYDPALAASATAGSAGANSRALEELLPERSQVLIAPPAKALSERLLAGVRRALVSQPAVRSGYLVEMQIAGKGESHLTLAIHSDADDETSRGILRDLRSKINPLLLKGESIDLIVLREDELSRSIQRSGAEIFRRAQIAQWSKSVDI